jgi:hypothetical protein
MIIIKKELKHKEIEMNRKHVSREIKKEIKYTKN